MCKIPVNVMSFHCLLQPKGHSKESFYFNSIITTCYASNAMSERAVIDGNEPMTSILVLVSECVRE